MEQITKDTYRNLIVRYFVSGNKDKEEYILKSNELRILLSLNEDNIDISQATATLAHLWEYTANALEHEVNIPVSPPANEMEISGRDIIEKDEKIKERFGKFEHHLGLFLQGLGHVNIPVFANFLYNQMRRYTYFYGNGFEDDKIIDRHIHEHIQTILQKYFADELHDYLDTLQDHIFNILIEETDNYDKLFHVANINKIFIELTNNHIMGENEAIQWIGKQIYKNKMSTTNRKIEAAQELYNLLAQKYGDKRATSLLMSYFINEIPTAERANYVVDIKDKNNVPIYAHLNPEAQNAIPMVPQIKSELKQYINKLQQNNIRKR